MQKVIASSQIISNMRLTIPPAVRALLDLQDGNIVNWVQVNGQIYMFKAEPPPIKFSQ